MYERQHAAIVTVQRTRITRVREALSEMLEGHNAGHPEEFRCGL